MPFLALGSRPPHSVAPRHVNLEPGEGLASLRNGCADAGQAHSRGHISLSAVTAPLARMEKRYLYLNRIYWPPKGKPSSSAPEASGQGLPLQQENSQRPQHSPTPFTASPNFIHSACPAQENCACQALDQYTQRAGHSSWEGALVPWQQQVAPTYQTSPVVPSVSRGHLLGGFSQQGSPCPPWGVLSL